MDIDDKTITEYINTYYTESTIRHHEDHILHILKTRYENDSTEENSQKWIDYTDFIIKRRLEK